MSQTLRELLVLIRDGRADAETLKQARELLAHDERFPEELRVEALTVEPELEAGGLLGLLGEPLEGLAEALAFEAGAFDVSAGVLAAIGAAPAELGDAVAHEAGRAELASAITHRVGGEVEPVAQAVAFEAGGVELASAVTAVLGGPVEPVAEAVAHEAGRIELAAAVTSALGGRVEPVAEALTHEAGRIEISALVAAALGADVFPVAHAVRNEAGRVDVASAVAASIGDEVLPLAEAVRAEAGTIDIADAVMSELSGRESLPAPVELAPAAVRPANNAQGYGWSSLVLAAAALFVVLVGNLPWSSAPPAHDLVFASAGEIQIDALEYGEQTMVHVVQGEAEQAPLIIWVDEEAVL